jgi:tetratricopeptide (TPR) repeat protein
VTLLGIAADTSPVPGAAPIWTTCIGVGSLLLDLLGRSREADRLLDELEVAARAVDEQEPIALAVLHFILTLRLAYSAEDPMQGLERGESLLRVSEAMEYRRNVEFAKTCMGMNRWCLGAFAGTDRMISGVTVPDSDAALMSSIRPFVLAWLLADQGNLDEARRWATQLVEANRTRPVPLDAGRGQWALAEVLRRAGELDGADAAIQAALALLRVASPLDTPGALATLAAVRLAQGRIAEALAAAEEGLAKYEAMGTCGFFRGAFLRLVHAESREATGDHEAAKAAIAAARARLLAIAAKIGDPEYRKSFLEGVPENRRTLELARQWAGPDDLVPR